jgi:mRNA interferase RelE/StbE
MGRYRVLIKPSAVREIESIPQKKQRQRIVGKIEALSDDPRPAGCEKLSGRERYRVRHGVYRIVYAIEDDRLVVFVVEAGHRSSVYR